MAAAAAAFLPCSLCPLRLRPLFKPFSAAELAFISTLKSDQVGLKPNAEIARAGEVMGRLYTLLEGWAFRYRALPDGRRQIAEFLLPGDLIGLELPLGRPVGSSVRA